MNEDGIPDSLQPLERLVEVELGFQQGHFESLDTKAGVVVGFAAAVVALVLDARVSGHGWIDMIVLSAVVLAGSSAVIAVASFWPREFQVLDVERVRDDALGRMPDVLTRVAFLDTHASVIGANRDLLHAKGVRLKVALVLRVVAAVLVAGGIVVVSVGGST